jgi:hypothetical protein
MSTGRSPLVAITIASTAVLSGACRRREAAAPTAAAAETSADVPSGCLETSPGPQAAAACTACLKKNSTTGKPIQDGCCGITDSVGFKACQAVAACVRAGGPPVGACNIGGDTTTCYCGKHQVGCDQPGKADGPCLAEITTAASRNIETHATDAPTPGQIMDRYGQLQYALGRAMNIEAIAGAFCKAECGIGM